MKPKRKPIMPLKVLDIIQRRRYVQNTQFYFTDRKVLAENVRQLHSKNVRPFRVPSSDKLLSFMKYSVQKEKGESRKKSYQPVHLKDDIRVAQSRDISERLFIPPVKDDVRTVLELHPEFYSVIEGRPLRTFDDIKVYMNNIRSYALLRQQIGYRRDIVMKIEKNLVEEGKQYEVVCAAYKRHVKDFEIFLREDYQKSVVKITNAQKVAIDLTAKDSEFLGYVSSLTILKNIIFKLDAIRNVLKIYRKYLLHVAPMSWRQKYDESYKRFSTQFDSDFENNAMGESTEIENVVQRAFIELQNPPKAYLYFSQPEEMMYLFRSLEIQSGEYLRHLSYMEAPMAALNERARRLRYAMAQEKERIDYYIQRLSAAIKRERENEAILKNMFFEILHGPFFETVASPNSLMLKICIEYVFDRVFGKSEDIHLNIREPMKLLELMYEEYNLKLDSLDFSIVKTAQNDFFSEDLRMMKLAYLAARELRSFEEMSNLVRKAFLPPFKSFRVKAASEKRKTTQKVAANGNQEKVLPHIPKLTETDKQNLCMFTEWCEGEDPKPFMEEYNKYIKKVLA